MDVNVDFRYDAGYPYWREALRWGVSGVRCTSLPAMDDAAGNYLSKGIRPIGIFTGESNKAGLYVMQNITALQIGNEPFMDGDASWPTGDADDFVNVWSHVANVVLADRQDLPLIGPGIWVNDVQAWASIAHRLPRLSAAAVHVYLDTLGYSITSLKSALKAFRAVRPDLPLLCTEWSARQPRVLEVSRAIDTYCDRRYWFAWGAGVPGHELAGTAELGILSLAA